MGAFAAERLKTVVITGASSGLGLAIAHRLMRGPYHLILTARSTSLPRFATHGVVESDRLWIRPLDVLNRTERNAVIDEVEKRAGGLDVLINNAGFAFRSVLEHVEQDELLQQMITNFWGPMELVRRALPGMRARRSGRIINISSVGGMMAMPTMAIYSASKFALEGATESLYYELKPWKIHVTLVEPGFINSDSFTQVRYTTQSGCAMRDPSEPYYGHYRFMTSFIQKIMKLSPASAESVARVVESVMNRRHPPLRALATPDAHLFDIMRRIMPRSLYHWILYQMLPHADCWGEEQRLRRRCAMEIEKAKG